MSSDNSDSAADFVRCSVHSLLYDSGVYCKEAFRPVLVAQGCVVQLCEHPSVSAHIDACVDAALSCERGAAMRLRFRSADAGRHVDCFLLVGTADGASAADSTSACALGHVVDAATPLPSLCADTWSLSIRPSCSHDRRALLQRTAAALANDTDTASDRSGAQLLPVAPATFASGRAVDVLIAD